MEKLKEEPKPEQVANLRKIYTLSKMLDLLALEFKKTHDSKYLNNKCDDMIEACELYYKAFDRHLNANTIDDLYEAIGCYHDIIGVIFSLDANQLQALEDIIKEIKENGITNIADTNEKTTA